MLGGGNSSNSSSNSQRRPVDTRAARLQALDKKTQNNNVNNSIP